LSPTAGQLSKIARSRWPSPPFLANKAVRKRVLGLNQKISQKRMLAVFTGERPESGLQAPVQPMGLKITREALRRNVDEKSFAF
jgi:hypothetical protein